MLKQSGARKWRSHTPNLLSLQLFAFRVISSAAWWGANLINLFYCIRLELLLKAVKNGFWLRSSSHPSTDAAIALLYSEGLRPFSPPKVCIWHDVQTLNWIVTKTRGVGHARASSEPRHLLWLSFLAGMYVGSQALIKLWNNVERWKKKLC